MKKMLLATALALLITEMCSTDVYCSKQTGSRSNVLELITIISSFLNWAEEKLSMQPKFVAAQKIVKKKTQQTFVNGLLGFITLGIYTPLEVRIAHNNCMSCSSIWATPSHCSLIYFWVPSSCFCIVIAFSEGEIIPFSGVCQSGGCIIHAGGGGGFTH